MVATKRGWQFYLNYLFDNVSFENMRMLDVGGGTGLLSFYAGCTGAREVICLEPAISGSRPGTIENFRRLQAGLRTLKQVRLEPTTIQEFNGDNEKFDIVLLHNSINHLDEQACTRLQHDDRAIETYLGIFQKLSDSSHPGAKLIITDCSRYNFFALFNLRNPFSPTIEWDKHQTPGYWAKLLTTAGFCNPEIRWTSFSRLRLPGRLVLGNKIASYFLRSHFCLIMEKG